MGKVRISYLLCSSSLQMLQVWSVTGLSLELSASFASPRSGCCDNAELKNREGEKGFMIQAEHEKKRE